jgi:hypothetical protein
MEYLILRLLFINPVGLPAMTESFLRKDFHFAMYLGYCYGKVLTRFFKWSVFTLLVLFVLIVTVDIVSEGIDLPDFQIYLAFTGLFIFLISLILIKSCLAAAHK